MKKQSELGKMSKNKGINIEKIVKETFKEPIRPDFGLYEEGSEGSDAREGLIIQLEIYHKVIKEAPKRLRPIIAELVTNALELSSPTVDILYKNARLSEKYFQLIEKYNQQNNLKPTKIGRK
ncbi:hypothetical protein ACFLZZ_02800 [Nanoarchaeota archaeon]